MDEPADYRPRTTDNCATAMGHSSLAKPCGDMSDNSVSCELV